MALAEGLSMILVEGFSTALEGLGEGFARDLTGLTMGFGTTF